MLTSNHRQMLEVAVFDHLGIPIAPQTLRDLLGVTLFQRVGNYATPFDYAKAVVRICVDQPGPELFVSVVAAVDGAALRYPDLHQIVADLANGTVTWQPASSSVLWVPDGWPFIDREDLRAAFVEMSNGGGHPAVVVEGGSGEGKWTMAQYLERFAEERGTFKVLAIELRRETSTSHDLRDLAAKIRVALWLDPDTDTTHAEPERQAQVLANELAQQAPLAAGPPVWIAAVVPTGTSATVETLRFLDQLLGHLQASPALAAKLRIVLLTEQITRLGLAHPPPLEARWVLPVVTRPHIVEWLKAAVPGKSDELYELSATLVLDEVTRRAPPPIEHLQLLAGQCIVAHRKLQSAGVT